MKNAYLGISEIVFDVVFIYHFLERIVAAMLLAARRRLMYFAFDLPKKIRKSRLHVSRKKTSQIESI